MLLGHLMPRQLLLRQLLSAKRAGCQPGPAPRAPAMRDEWRDASTARGGEVGDRARDNRTRTWTYLFLRALSRVPASWKIVAQRGRVLWPIRPDALALRRLAARQITPATQSSQLSP